MTVGQSSYLDQATDGLVTDATALNKVVVAVTAPLVGSLTLLDGDGTTQLSLTAGQSGAFTVASPVYRLEYHLSSPADMGNVVVSYHPI